MKNGYKALGRSSIAGLLLAGMMGASSLVPVANAQSIELLLVEKLGVPTKRPPFDPDKFDASRLGPLRTDTFATGSAILPLSGFRAQEVTAVSGSLKQGLDALSKGDGARALGIRAGLAPGSLDRKILAWALALSGDAAVSSSTISKIARDLPDWPGQDVMARNLERALAREDHPPQTIVSAFQSRKPASVQGAALLANAHLKLGQRQQASQVIEPVWRSEKLDPKSEKLILEKAGSALDRDDHRHRMHMLLYNDRVTAAGRIQSKAEQVSLAKARAAVIRKSGSAASLLKSVAPSSKLDAGYLFAQIEHARRTEKYDTAASLLLKAPRDPAKLIDPSEWWVERRIVSRQMIEKRQYSLAYKLVAEHASTEAKDIVDAEFHAGWYALRFLNDPGTARKHFARLLQHATLPATIARGQYWMGRASNSASARSHFKQAAAHSETYYGQLAASELNTRKIKVNNPKPGFSDRSRFAQRELVRAIERLESLGHGKRTGILYRHLGKTLKSPGELAILSARAERNGDFRLGLQVGKLGHARGLDMGTVAWPLGAIPASARIGDTGRALAYAIARQESEFNVGAVSPANARGLLQLLPGTAKAVAKRKGLSYSKQRLTSDGGYNATLGAAYLSEQLDKFGGSYVLTFAAYNAGPGRVAEWLERFGDPRGRKLYDVIDWVEMVPFTETRKYVQKVMENYQVYKARISASRLDIASDLTRGRR